MYRTRMSLESCLEQALRHLHDVAFLVTAILSDLFLGMTASFAV
jgi:hypothetical protein